MYPLKVLGCIQDYLQTEDHTITGTHFYASTELPPLDDIDLLVVLGGPMSVNDIGEYPWLTTEKQYIRKVIKSGKPTLGICLGAQLIASALGANVFPNAVKEIGWYPIRATRSAKSSSFSFPEHIEVFHWHGETFSLPTKAVLLAESDGCRNQAFQLGDNVIALQFHLETTPDTAREIVANCRDELVPGKYIQTEEDILSAPQERYRKVNTLMCSILEYLCKNSG